VASKEESLRRHADANGPARTHAPDAQLVLAEGI